MSKLHLDVGSAAELADYDARAVPCNRRFLPASQTTADRDAVTCGNCKRWIAQHPERVEPAAEPFEPGPAYPVLRKRWEHADIARRSREGDEADPEVERFRDVHHALREWARWRGADVSHVSGSSWARLAPPPPGEEPRRNAYGSRIDRKLRTHRVELAVLEACEAGHAFAGGEDGSGALMLSAGQCLEIIARRASGEEASAFCERIETGGVMSTPTQCGIVWRRVLAHVEAALRERGLLLHARAKHNTRAASTSDVSEGDEMALLPEGYDIDGWKAVASAIGYSESHCRVLSRAAKDPLPVSEMRGRIVAKSSELRAWLARQVKPKAGAA